MFREIKVLAGFKKAWLINGIALLFLSFIYVRGENLIHIGGFMAAVFSSAFSGVINAVLMPVAVYVKIPLKISGVFLTTLVANLLILIFLSSLFGPGFYIHGFFRWIFTVLILSVVSMITAYILKMVKN